jgi:hypothetical protein
MSAGMPTSMPTRMPTNIKLYDVEVSKDDEWWLKMQNLREYRDKRLRTNFLRNKIKNSMLYKYYTESTFIIDVPDTTDSKKSKQKT